jgi:hypothetical protein
MLLLGPIEQLLERTAPPLKATNHLRDGTESILRRTRVLLRPTVDSLDRIPKPISSTAPPLDHTES